MLRVKLATAAALTLTLGACAAPAGTSPFRLFYLIGPVQVPAPSYALNAVRAPYALDRLDRIEIWTRKGTAAYYSAGTLLPVGTGDTGRVFPAVKLANLEPRAEYDVQLRAFQVLPGDTVATDVTESGYANSTTHVSTVTASDTEGANEVVSVSAFRLKFTDQTFQGVSTGSIAPSGGGLVGDGTLIAAFTFEEPLTFKISLEK